MHESPRRSNHLQRRLPKGEDRLKSAKHQGTNQPKRCGTEFNRQPQKRLRCVHNLGYNLNCWLLLFNRAEAAKTDDLKHTTLATARLRFLFVAAKIWRHAGRVGIS